MRYLWLATVCLLSCATPASRPHPAPAGSEVVDPASGGLPPLAGAWLSPEQATCGDAELHAL